MQIGSDGEYTKPNVWNFCLFHDASSVSHVEAESSYCGTWEVDTANSFLEPREPMAACPRGD